MNDGYITWCEACHYNIKPESKKEKKHRFDKMYDKLGEKFGQSMFETMANQREKSFSYSIVLVMFLATLIHSMFICLFLTAVLIPFIWGITFGTTILIGLSLLFGWLLRPRLNKLNDSDRVFSRHELPALFKIMDDICCKEKIKPIDGVILNGEYNASIGSYGWKQKRIITIGLPLFHVLRFNEKVSILAHEIGHLHHGDTLKAWYIGTAQDSLATWFEILHPDENDSTENMWLFEIPAYYIMKWLSYIPYAGYYLFGQLLYQDSQRAEYEADQFQASISGSEVAISAMEKMPLANIVESIIQRTAVSRKQIDVFQNIQEAVKQLPLQELKRIRTVGELEKTRLSMTHPPTYYRIRMFQAKKQFPSLTFGLSLEEKLSSELSQFHRTVQEEVFEHILWTIS